MDNIQIVIIVAVVLFFVLKKLGQVSPEKARQLVKEGAVIIDVRTPGEFAGGHLKDAVNLPLDVIGTEITKVMTHKTRPILVYCLSGTRSGFAKRILLGKHYTEVHNLGSMSRAMSIFQ